MSSPDLTNAEITAVNQVMQAPVHDVIYAHQLRVSIDDCIRGLEFIAKTGEPEDMIGQVLFLPL